MPVTINGTTGIAGPDGSASTPAVQGTDSNTGLFYPAADTVALSTGGSERMRITSAGFVGIGTSSPAVPLDVVAQTSASIARFRGRSSDNIATLEWYDNTNATRYTYISSGPSSSSFWNQANTPMAFGTNDTERMRITSGGTLCIATTTAVSGSYLTVNGKAAFASNLVLEDGGGVGWSGNPTVRNTAGSGYLIMMNGTTGGVGLTNGGTSWTSISDERYKTNLAPIANGLQKVSQLRSVTGRFINDEEDKSRSFLIAQDVQQVLPEAISVADDGRMLLSYTDMIPLLVAAVKDLKAIVDAQAARISALEAA